LTKFDHLQSRDPFKTFSIELADGRVIQIYAREAVERSGRLSY
jgi:hypothetical protein